MKRGTAGPTARRYGCLRGRRSVSVVAWGRGRPCGERLASVPPIPGGATGLRIDRSRYIFYYRDMMNEMRRAFFRHGRGRGRARDLGVGLQQGLGRLARRPNPADAARRREVRRPRSARRRAQARLRGDQRDRGAPQRAPERGLDLPDAADARGRRLRHVRRSRRQARVHDHRQRARAARKSRGRGRRGRRTTRRTAAIVCASRR